MSKLKFKSPEIKLISRADGMENAWRKSKPTLGYDDTEQGREKLRLDLDGLMSNDLPICGFHVFSFEATTSLILRDMTFCVRPINPWASSNRIEKRTWENSYIDNILESHHNLHPFVEKDLDKVISAEEKGVALDLAKRDLPLMMMTTYNFTMDFRSLMCYLKTLDEIDREGLRPLISEYLYAIKDVIFQYKDSNFKRQIKTFSKEELINILYNYFYEHPAKSIFDRLSIPEEYINKNGDYLKKNISKASRNELTFELGVYISNALSAQFVRQHYSKIRYGYFNRIKKDGYLSMAKASCSDKEFAISTGDVQALDQLVTRRTCWVAQFDWNDEFGWASIIGGIVKNMNREEFKNTLPCYGSCHKCTIKDETKLRLHTKTRQGAADGHVPDENPLCPILVENPEWMKERVEFYKSQVTDNPVMEKWLDLAGHVVYNPNNKGTLVYEGKLDVTEYDTKEVTQYSENVPAWYAEWINSLETGNYKKEASENILDFIESIK